MTANHRDPASAAMPGASAPGIRYRRANPTRRIVTLVIALIVAGVGLLAD